MIYTYDAAGNIIEKLEHGLTTTMTYDAANQLVGGTQTDSSSQNTRPSMNSRQTDGARSPEPTEKPAPTTIKPTATIQYHYDAAGRQYRIEGPEGVIERRYGWLDKVIHITKADGSALAFDYYPDGHLAVKGPLGAMNPIDPNATPPANSTRKENRKEKTAFDLLRNLIKARSNVDEELDDTLQATPEQLALQPQEEFVWDGLALLWKSGTGYAVEPHPSGGTCVAAFRGPNEEPTYFLNDILGTTLAVVEQGRVQVVPMTAFGKPLNATRPVPPPEDLTQPGSTPLSQSNNAAGELAENIKHTKP